MAKFVRDNRVLFVDLSSNDQLVAGKGHEKYQDINGVKHHFDDKEMLNEIFKALDK